MKSFAFLLLLFATVKKGQSEIKCELKSGVNSALNKVGSAALRGIYFHENRNSQNMHLMDCYCVDEDVSQTFDIKIHFFKKLYFSCNFSALLTLLIFGL